MKKLSTFLLLSLSLYIFGQEQNGYYTTAGSKTGAELKTALSAIVETHTQRTYANLWTDMQTTDKKADGKVWDVYSNCSFTFGTNQDSGSGGTAECQFYNREHSFPKSWMGIGSNQENSVPMGTDLFHLYPTDKYVIINVQITRLVKLPLLLQLMEMAVSWVHLLLRDIQELFMNLPMNLKVILQEPTSIWLLPMMIKWQAGHLIS